MAVGLEHQPEAAREMLPQEQQEDAELRQMGLATGPTCHALRSMLPVDRIASTSQ